MKRPEPLMTSGIHSEYPLGYHFRDKQHFEEWKEQIRADQRRECAEELEWILPEQSKGDDLWQCFWDNSKKLISKWKQDNTREGMKAEQQKISDKLKAILCNPDGECCISGTDADRDIIDEAIEELQVLENTRQLERIDGGDLNDVLMMIDPKKICPDDTTYHFGVITDAISSRFGTSRQDIEKAKADQRRECAEELEKIMETMVLFDRTREVSKETRIRWLISELRGDCTNPDCHKGTVIVDNDRGYPCPECEDNTQESERE